MAQDERIVRLARQIDAARKAEEHRAVSVAEVEHLRRQGAGELHRVCTEFVESVNGQLTEGTLDLSPATFAPEAFRGAGTNLFQVASQGRQLQIVFGATRELFSTEKFLIPYVLEGEVRTYNQKMLERFEVRSRMVFYCVSELASGWRFFDWRTRQTGAVDRQLLVSLMEPLF
jgi:hypothetical protein